MSPAGESDVIVLSSSDGEGDYPTTTVPSRRSSRSATVSSRIEHVGIAAIPKKQLNSKKEVDPAAKSAENGKNAKKRKREEGAEEEKETISSPTSCTGDFVATSEGSGLSSGTWAFPMTRMRRLISGGDGSNDKNLRTTLDSAFIIDQAAKLFLEGLAEEAYVQATRDRKKSLFYKHLSSAVGREKRYEFLSDFVPEKVKAEVALRTLAED